MGGWWIGFDWLIWCLITVATTPRWRSSLSHLTPHTCTCMCMCLPICLCCTTGTYANYHYADALGVTHFQKYKKRGCVVETWHVTSMCVYVVPRRPNPLRPRPVVCIFHAPTIDHHTKIYHPIGTMWTCTSSTTSPFSTTTARSTTVRGLVIFYLLCVYICVYMCLRITYYGLIDGLSSHPSFSHPQPNHTHIHTRERQTSPPSSGGGRKCTRWGGLSTSATSPPAPSAAGCSTRECLLVFVCVCVDGCLFILCGVGWLEWMEMHINPSIYTPHTATSHPNSHIHTYHTHNITTQQR